MRANPDVSVAPAASAADAAAADRLMPLSMTSAKCAPRTKVKLWLPIPAAFVLVVGGLIPCERGLTCPPASQYVQTLFLFLLFCPSTRPQHSLFSLPPVILLSSLISCASPMVLAAGWAV